MQDPESTDQPAPDDLAIAAAMTVDQLIAELQQVAAYANDPHLAQIRQAYLSGLAHGRGINPNTYTMGTGDSPTTAHEGAPE